MPVNLPKDDGGAPMPVAQGSGNRANLTAAATTSNGALPTGSSRFVIVRCTDYIWLIFGDDSVEAAADATSILCPPGEGAYKIASTDTHAGVLRVGAEDVIVQLESFS